MYLIEKIIQRTDYLSYKVCGMLCHNIEVQSQNLQQYDRFRWYPWF